MTDIMITVAFIVLTLTFVVRTVFYIIEVITDTKTKRRSFRLSNKLVKMYEPMFEKLKDYMDKIDDM